MECPRLHGMMQTIDLSPDPSEPHLAYFCEHCHAVCVSDIDCHDWLGLDYQSSSRVCDGESGLWVPSIDLKCARCSESLLAARVCGWNAYVCPRCHSWFLDAGVLPFLMHEYHEKLRSAGAHIELEPVELMPLKCADCGVEIPSIKDVFSYDYEIGCYCKKCGTNLSLSETKQQEVQIVTFHGMEVKIDRLKRSNTSRIMVTPVQPGKLNVFVHSLSTWERIKLLGWRKLALRGELRSHIDASEGIERCTPWSVFLKQRGVVECLQDIQQLGDFRITFKPHNLIFELDGDRVGAETRLHFEEAVRRMLILYERYEKMLLALYDTRINPEDDEALQPLDADL